MLKFLINLLKRKRQKENPTEIIEENGNRIELNRTTGTMRILTNKNLTIDEITELLKKYL
jgi:hypothetical protein